MIIEIKIPTPGESITEVELGKWLVENGSIVNKDEEIAEVESDKATLTLVAEASGEINFKVEEGDTVAVGTIVCTIDTDKVDEAQNMHTSNIIDVKTEPKAEEIAPITEALATPVAAEKHIKVTPVAAEMIQDNNLSVDDIINGLKRIGKKEVEMVINGSEILQTTISEQYNRSEKKEKMSMLRKKLSKRLVTVKNETAMLTTFNEVDMKPIMDLRTKYQKQFVDKHGFKLGFMSFFTKACAVAMQYHPAINSMIEGEEIIEPNYVDIGIAVQTPKGLMVPIVRDASTKDIPNIELEIKELAEKARNKKISIEELTGGTFTITNGGTFGSLLSTPIINPPQSAILGMHNIVDRPVAINGKVEIRPMMYLALSYDHRLIDGKDSVGFLVKVKTLLENPQTLLSAGKNIEELLLGI